MLHPVGPAAGPESTTLLEVKERPAELMKRQLFVQTADAQDPGIERFEPLSRRGLAGHEAMPYQRSMKRCRRFR